MSVFSAERAGQELVEAHDEDDGRAVAIGHGEAGAALEHDVDLLVFRPLPPGPGDLPCPGRIRADVGRARSIHSEAEGSNEGGPPSARTVVVDELRSAKPHSPGVGIAEALLAVGVGDSELARRRMDDVLSDDPSLRVALSKDPDLGGL